MADTVRSESRSTIAEIHATGIAIAGGTIAGLGEGYQAREVHDLQGRFVAPGFLDAHVHIESSMVTPAEFARAVTPRGVTTGARPGTMVGVLGCMAERLKKKFLEEEQLVDMVVGPDAYRSLPGLIEEAETEAQSPVRNQPFRSLLARRLCHYLDTRNTNP